MADQVNFATGLVQGAALATPMPSAAKPGPVPSRPANVPAMKAAVSSPLDTVKTAEVAMAQVNGHLEQTGSDLKFEVDEATGRQVFKVVDPGNGQVLLQVPSDEMLALARNVLTMQQKMDPTGVLVDKQG